MIIDSHAHLDLFKDKELKEILERAKKTNVKYVINNSVDIKTANKSLELSKKYPMIKVALGIYPEDALSIEREQEVSENFIEFKKLVLANKKMLSR